MKSMLKPVAALVIVGSLAACSSNYGPKETGGTLLGAGLGALAGSQIGSGRGQMVAVGVGTLVGALLGNEVGKSLDRADREHAERAAQDGLESTPTGESTEWYNPDSGNHGSFTPTRTYQQSSGAYCREYQQTIVVGGQAQSGYGTACRQPDGSWQIASQ